ncbi:MoaF N-terminal domain-containing protein [Alteraurantiacibacter aquimixticola]|uniref:Molybdenum cofactor biosynthesis protein F n=1 Tax=Alteraurantiacibacter aquimixticola TaxID=2489173 RepID=A0A4T3F3S0_9SPHN|nr:MoaF N-terminal domain-containing protein [Alteraurantiacibacter aquimixticola]TIX51873.1 hypothetical protein E5222_05380 [Alteraurantiacibacter aquimixticola]
MPSEAYPDLPLFRIDWTAMTDADIGARLNAVAAEGPKCASRTDLSLAGQTMQIVCDKGTTGVDGPSLSYRFNTGNRLSLSENAGGAVDAGYAALELGDLTFLAHLLPGSLRGYAVVVDNHTHSATVFELWFGGYKRKREVMREVYQGYVHVDGQAPSEVRHEFNNRLEGAGYFWRQDTGAETLEFYDSIAYTHWVELSRMDRSQGYCAPADYIEIGHGKYIYTRTECEFSGMFTVYTMDVNALKQVGLRLGFNAADELEFYVFRGTGEWLGQIAKFEDFGVTEGGPMLPRPGPGQTGEVDATAKGARAVYRPMETYATMTKAEVDAIVPDHTRVFAQRVGAGSGATGMAANVGTPSDKLVGKTATIRYDGGPVMDYEFTSVDELRYRKDGGAWTSTRYHAWEAIDDVFLMGHVLHGEPNHDGHITVLDFEEGKATCYNGYLNTPYIANEAGCRPLFGKLEAEGVPDPGVKRHEFTEDMLGRCITYSYSPGLTSMHFYSTPSTTSWIIFTPTGSAGLQWAGSGAQIKIRDGLYFLYWIEEACNGTLGTILLNLRTMHDIGIGYHCGTEGLSMSPVSALLRHAGQFDLDRFYQHRTRS